ncbi:hypothetical protein [Massilia sp. 9I]|uniref:hypothetical protein n=1 Tax=Massilia sp. 9I TaxID=2653152 RepID=UPI00135A851F|nr:hypothetical protein [Massilia sp. 9I]
MSISAASQFSPPFNGRVKCPTCGSELKVRQKLTNFILPIYLLGRVALSQLFGLRFDAGMFWEMLILLALGFVQIRFIAYKEVKRPEASLQPRP